MFALIRSGGILMIPIILCALFVTFVIFERLFFFFSVKKKDAALAVTLNQMMPVLDYNGAIRACSSAGTPTAIVLRKAIECRRLASEELQDIVCAEAGLVIPRYERLLAPLGTAANVSTMLGLLGTVTGNIQAFGVLGSGSAMADPAALASAIAAALVTTAAGLVVAIPALIFHSYFMSLTNQSIARMEAAAMQLIFTLKKGL